MAAGERVVSLFKQLNGNVSELRQETAALQAARAQWAPIELPKSTDAKSIAAIPQRCAEKLTEAAGHERRTVQATRRIRANEREAQRFREQQHDVETTANASEKAAEQRRLDAEHRIAAIKMERQQAEAQHRSRLAAEETDHEVELGNLERKIVSAREQAAQQTADARQKIAWEKKTNLERIGQARADFERERLQFERSLDDFDLNADAAIAAAQQKAKDAEEAAKAAWSQFEEHSKAAHAVAADRVIEYTRSRDSTVGDVNAKLAEIEENLDKELGAVSAREEAASKDQSAEQRLEAVRIAVMDEICRRRNECDTNVAAGLDKIARRTSEASEAAASTAARIKAVQEDADKQVEDIRRSMEKFAEGSHQGKIMELQAKLGEAIAAARSEFVMRLQRFQDETSRQSREADQALVAADQRVEDLRQKANARMEAQVISMSQDISSIRGEREQLVAETDTKVRKTQDQMVQYIGSQFQDMLESLQQTDPPEVPIRLDFTALALAGEPYFGIE